MAFSASQASQADNRVGAADQARVLQGGSSYAESTQTVNTAAGAQTLLGSMAGNAVKTGSILNKGNLSISSADPQVARDALAAMANASAQFAQNSAAMSGNYTAAQSADLNGALSQISDLTKVAQTGGASLASSTIKQIVLIGLAIVGLVVMVIVWRKHKA